MRLLVVVFALAYAAGAAPLLDSSDEHAARSESAAQTIGRICQLKASKGLCGTSDYCKRDFTSQQQVDDSAEVESPEAADVNLTSCSLCLRKFPDLFCKPHPRREGTRDAME